MSLEGSARMYIIDGHNLIPKIPGFVWILKMMRCS